MKRYAIALLFLLTALTASSQPGTVLLSEKKAEEVRKALLHLDVVLAEYKSCEKENDTLRSALADYKQAAEFAKQEAGAQRAIAGISARETEAIRNTALAQAAADKRKLWKARAFAAGGYLLAGIFGYIVVTDK